MSYVPHTVELVLLKADRTKIAKHISHCISVNMGFSEFSEDQILAFAEKLERLSLE